ncbi:MULTISPECIES: hypothetical protein [Dickeya]|uniref:hypothetical protein n=1 Tax=Dickeya TaxID=204037 RepID=UPI00315F530C
MLIHQQRRPPPGRSKDGVTLSTTPDRIALAADHEQQAKKIRKRKRFRIAEVISGELTHRMAGD